MIKNKFKTFIVTGGTGGHIFPALNFSDFLNSKGVNNLIITDYRGSKYIDKNKYNYKIIPSSHLNKKNIKFILGIILLFFGFIYYLMLFIQKRPKYIVTFGSYTSFMPILCSYIFRRLIKNKIFFHEQNSVIGRVHNLFSFSAEKIFLTFKETSQIKNKFFKKTIHSGLPMYKNLYNFRKTNLKVPSKNEKFKFLVFGGSQGSSNLAKITVNLLLKLSKDYQKLIYLTIQAPDKDFEIIKNELDDSHIQYEIKSYYNDLLNRISRANLCICRSGSSTINELINLKCPSILVPLPTAIANHQFYNAKFLSDNEAAILIQEKDLLKKETLNILEKYILNPVSLRKMFDNLGNIEELDSNEIMYNNIYNEK